MPSRAVLTAAIGAVLVAAFAALPAPEVIYRKSPTVADRRPGDVRRVSMVAEENGILHAVLEVWTDSDWDIEYWSSIPALTPKARVVTNDLIEQRQTTIGIRGQTLGLAWVDYDMKTRRSSLKATMKAVRHRDWRMPWVVVKDSADPIAILKVESARDSSPLLLYSVGGQAHRWHAFGDLRPAPVSSPSVIRPVEIPVGAVAFARFRDGLWLAFLRDRTAGAIYRVAEITYTGAPGAYRGSATVPVVALVAQ